MNYAKIGFIAELESRGCSPEQSRLMLKKAEAHPEIGALFTTESKVAGVDPELEIALYKQASAEAEYEALRAIAQD